MFADFSLMKGSTIIHDEMRIQQVILNLQSNALKFTDKGKIVIKVKTFVKDGSKHLEISVIDTGIGIKEEDQNKLFKLFGYIQDS